MILLQSALDRLLEGDIFGVIVDVFGSAMPIPLLATVVFGGIGVSYYVVQRSVAIPLVMFIMIGGTTIARAPTIFQQGIIATFILAIAGLGYVLLNRVRV